MTITTKVRIWYLVLALSAGVIGAQLLARSFLGEQLQWRNFVVGFAMTVAALHELRTLKGIG